MPSSFDIKLTGKTLPGYAPDAVASGLANLMKISPERAADLLAGHATTIKRGLDADRVPRYLQAIEAIGAEVRADGCTESTAPLIAPPAMTTKAAAELALVPIAPTGGEATEAPDSIKCPACGTVQPKRNLCHDCGADMPRMLAAQEGANRQPQRESPAASPYAPPPAAVGNARFGADDLVTPPAFGLSFEGRIGRVRYLAYGLPVYLPLMIGAILASLFMGEGRSMLPIVVFGGIGVVLTLIMAVRIAVLRLHDFNLSGRWLLLPIVGAGLASLGGSGGVLFVAAVMIVGSLALLLVRGSDGDNNFGPPSGPNTALTVVGAIIVVVLGGVGKMTTPNSYPSAPPTPPGQEQDE
jgi:uncharacterized membrane protein YhaH (DUF805 family)